jgi:DNA-binding transcriptional regulator YiaG
MSTPFIPPVPDFAPPAAPSAPASPPAPPTAAQVIARLRTYLQASPRGTSARFARACGISRQTLNAWLHTRRQPSADHLLAILHTLRQPDFRRH